MDEEVDDEEDDFVYSSQSAQPESFHGVYLLHCINPQFKGRTYIGYTVNPNRRINQHNAGRKKGGAWKTSGRGPWEMTLIIHGFPSGISALRFEWAWQHPKSSRRLSKSTLSKLRGESSFNFCIRVLAELLRVGPWDRLPLTIRWLKQQYAVSFPVHRQPPLHMNIAYGPIATFDRPKHIGTLDNAVEESDSNKLSCGFCSQTIERSQAVTCVKSSCGLESCITCLAEIFLDQDSDSPEFILPIKGTCPVCKTEGLWKDFVKQRIPGGSVQMMDNVS